MITKTPEVGKYLVENSVMTFGCSGSSCGLITKISGKRIYYVNEYDFEKNVMSFSAICDTIEEVKQLQDFSRNCVFEAQELKNRQHDEFLKFFSE